MDYFMTKRNCMIHKILRKTCMLMMTLMACMALHAEDNITFKASAPKQVVQGQPFQVVYTVNKRAGNIQPPEFVDFDFLAGPYESQSSSSTFVNGQFTSTFTHQFTYTLMPTKQGTFTLGAATVKVGGKTLTSNGVRITVLPPDETPSQESVQQSGNNRGRQQASSAQGTSGNGDIFIRTIASKTKLFEQEVLTLSYKLYVTGMDIRGFTEKTQLPEFTGFLKTDLDQKDIQFELEHYNNRNYQVATIYRTLLYPQHSGDIEIDPASFEAVILIPNTRRRSFFDDAYIQATKPLKAPGMTIHVDALPAGKPAGYAGGVGTFTMTSSISGTEVKTNDAITIRMEIRGQGNMKLLKTPAVDWPEGFEAYDPKVTNNFKTTTSGVSGSKQIEFLAIARNSGEYVIPAITFAYFDTEEKKYVSLSTDEYTIHVAKGAGGDNSETQAVVSNYTNTREDIKELGTDIRYINTTPVNTRRQAETISGGLIAVLYLVPLILAIVLFIIFRKRIRENADMTRMRYKRANKVAQKRLKLANQLLSQNNKAGFYEEIEHAAFSYLSDRLSIPTSDLSKDNIADILRQKKVSEEDIQEVTRVLTTAEFARYAPSTDSEMQSLYDSTVALINNLENQSL